MQDGCLTVPVSNIGDELFPKSISAIVVLLTAAMTILNE